MSLTRRELLTRTAQLAAAAAFRPASGALPARRDFAIPAGQAYLNSAFIHPIPIAAANAATRYIESRTFSRERWSGDDLAVKVREQFASLINARAAEISLVESTSQDGRDGQDRLEVERLSTSLVRAPLTPGMSKFELLGD